MAWEQVVDNILGKELILKQLLTISYSIIHHF